DTTVPLVGNSAQRAHGTLSADGDRNIVDAVDYINSQIWAGEDGRDEVGAVAILDELIFTSREVQKGDARPGGYVATGGHGGVLGRVADDAPAYPTVLTFIPNRLHTHRSSVNLTQLPLTVSGVSSAGRVVVPIKDELGDLLPGAIPKVRLVKGAGQYSGSTPLGETGRSLAEAVDVLAATAAKVAEYQAVFDTH